MWKPLRNLLAAEFAQLEQRVAKLERQLEDTLTDAATLHEKTFRLHQRLVKRAARAAEDDDTGARQAPVVSRAEEINARINARRNRRGVPQGVLDAERGRADRSAVPEG